MEIRKTADDILRMFGAKPDRKGYEYIIDALEMIAQDETLMYKTTTIYKMLAKKYGLSTYMAAEAGIRRCRESALHTGKKEDLARIINVRLANDTSYKVTNSEFIAAIYDYIKYRM